MLAEMQDGLRGDVAKRHGKLEKELAHAKASKDPAAVSKVQRRCRCIGIG